MKSGLYLILFKSEREYMKNYLKIKKKWHWPGTISYVFIDTKDYLADQLFIMNMVPVKFGVEYEKAGKPYRVIFCSIKKKYEEKFLESLKYLPARVMWDGNYDYEEFCDYIIGKLEEGIKGFENC